MTRLSRRASSRSRQVAGYVTAVPVTDNQHVNKGDVIAGSTSATTSRRSRKPRLKRRERKPASTMSTRRSRPRTRRSPPPGAGGPAQANQELAKVTWGRDQPLVKKGWATAQQGTTDVQNLKAQQANVDSAQAALKVAQRQIDTLRAQRASAEASSRKRRPSSTRPSSTSPIRRSSPTSPAASSTSAGAVGQYAQAGTNLAMFVPDEIWVTANYKETQLDRMRPGQPVDIEIDAYPERAFHGHVASVQPGSGPAFSLLPPENATGNYVKIVQRVPVKLILDNPPTDVSLGPGMSVVPTVRVDPKPSLYEKLKARLRAVAGARVSDTAAPAGAAPAAGGAAPTNPWIIAVLVALAAFMEVLDTTIANVVLPYIAGGMGVSVGRSVLGGDDLSGRQRHQPDGEPVPGPIVWPQDLLPDVPRALQRKLDPLRAGVESSTRSSCSASCKAWLAAAWCRCRNRFWPTPSRRRSAARPSRCSASRWLSRRWSARRSAAGSPTITPGAGAS